MTRSCNHTTDCKCFLLLIFALLLSTVAVAQGNQIPDKLLVDAQIHTLNARQPWAEALAIKEGKTVAVGSNKQIRALSGSSSKTVDAKDHLVLPGFTDCHIHFMDGSPGLDRVDLKSVDSVVEMQKRVKAYAENGGGTLAFGSDWPVVTLNPWPGVQTAVTRQTTEGNPPGGRILEQGIGLADAIKAYILNAAFAGHREKAEGSLESGKLADLIVLGEAVLQVLPGRLSRTEVMLTMAGEKFVYQASTWATACCPGGGHE